ncbi:MAG: hypothetical protein CBC91_06870 [Rickettsiales bacterium TMED131]|nr:MAG: hypothetical protein CBC91_06870 [Rickettsiales bacterium TMED131]
MRLKEKDVSVEKEDGTKVDIVVKRPTAKDLSTAQKLGSKVWTDSVRDGLFTKEGLEKFMTERGIWDKSKQSQQEEIVSQIDRLEKDIALGRSTSGKKMKVSEGKEKALQVRRLRIKLRELVSERIALEGNTAESIADNARFNFLVASCVFYKDGKKVYNSLDEYNSQAEDEVAFAAAAALGELMYSLDQNYEENLPENRFLKKFNLVDDDLSLINTDGKKVDIDGTLVNDDGWLVNKDGHRIDREGNLLTEDGQLELQGDYDDDVNDVKPKTRRKKTTE